MFAIGGKRYFRFIAIIIFTFVLGGVQAYGQNSINGMVFDEKRQPLSNVDVELLDEFYRRISNARTSAGSFMFNNLRAGNYYVKVRPINANYREKIESVGNLGINNGVTPTNRSIGRDSIQLQIYLEPINRNQNINQALVVFAQDVPEEAKKKYQQAVAENEKGNGQQALAGIKDAIKIFPRYYDALLWLGNRHAKEGKYPDAEFYLSKALDVNPKGVGCLEGLGFVKYKLNKPEESAELFLKALLINSQSVDSYLWLGIIHRMAKNYAEAEKYLKKGNQVANKSNPNLHWQLALLYNDVKRYWESAEELVVFLKLQPDSQDKDKIEKLIVNLREKSKNQSNK